MANLSTFKRKWIERWCEDVSSHLRNGNMCNSVLGHVVEEPRTAMLSLNGPLTIAAITMDERVGVSSASHPKERDEEGRQETQKRGSSSGTHFSQHHHHHHFPHHLSRQTHASAAENTSFPAVRFTYSHHQEQRRKIDRLVQGLPVLPSPSTPPGQRTSYRSRDDHEAVIMVHGEEPAPRAGGRASRKGEGSSSGQRGQERSRTAPLRTNHPRFSDGVLSAQVDLSLRPHPSAAAQQPPTPPEGQESQENGSNAPRVRTAPHSKKMPATLQRSQNVVRARQRLLAKRSALTVTAADPRNVPLQNGWTVDEFDW